MAYNFKQCDRDQQFLLPVDMRDWLPDDHLVWFVLDAVDRLDLSRFYGSYRDDGWGRAAFHPQMMVGLVLYAYAVSERSSRRIEARCREDVAFRIAAANHTPDHSTIARFMVRHEDALKDLFVQVLGLCVAAGHVRTTVVAIDGTKMEADASSARNVTREQLEAYAARVFAEAQAIDAEEDRLYGDRRGDEVPENIADRKQRLQWLDEQLAEREGAEDEAYEQRMQERAAREAETGRKIPGRKPQRRSGRARDKRRVHRINMTDPESRSMRTAQGYMQGFNAQAAVSDDHFVIATDVTSGRADAPHFVPLLDQAVANLETAEGRPIATAVADAGYRSRMNCSTTLPSGTVLIATDGWTSTRGHGSQEMADMSNRLTDPVNQARLRRRSQIAEPVFGNIKGNLGAKRFRRRGLDACGAEWTILCTTHNLRRLRAAASRRPLNLFCPLLQRGAGSGLA